MELTDNIQIDFVEIPFYEDGLSCGLPSDPGQSPPNTLPVPMGLVSNPSDCYAITLVGDSMNGKGFSAGDIIIVDSTARPHTGDLVVARIDGEFVFKEYVEHNGGIFLVPANRKYRIMEVTPDTDFQIQGVMVWHMRQHRHEVSGLMRVREEIFKQEEELETVGKADRKKDFRDCIISRDEDERDQLLRRFHDLLDGKGAACVYAVVKVAMDCGLILNPTYNALKGEFGRFGDKSTYSRAKNTYIDSNQETAIRQHLLK